MLAATGIGARWQVGNEHDANQERLEALADETSARITTSLSRYADLLVSIAALETSGAGTYPEFERFTAGVGVGSRPGVKASSFIVEVAEDELAELTARERAAGQPDFAPKLSGDGPLHAVVAHRWPADEGVTGFDQRRSRAMGSTPAGTGPGHGDGDL